MQPRTAESVIQDFWRLCAAGEYTKTLPLFSKTAVYYDTLYPNPFVGEEAIAKHLSNMESAIPGGLVSVELDEIAAGTEKVGARWHLETKDGSPVQFTRGASMYTIIEEDAELRIAEAWDFVETPFKVAGIILPVLRGAATILKAFENLKAP